ncbi:MAG TPA: hypothetical protein VGI76_10735 [Solirubrobacteraceae bacterium]
MTEGRREHSPIPPTEPPDEPRRGAESTAEFVGPLLVEHHRKRDGRLLILYRTVEDR